jgi:outer membrane protein OmpA-like peptidoglycan-associated protein
LQSLNEIAMVKQEARGLVITLQGQVLFRSGKADLLPIAREQLGKVSQALQQQDVDKSIVVEGYTDSRGSAKSNLRLSRERAEAVRLYLVEKGLDSTRVVAIGKGEANPVASNANSEGRANNRRVEIVLSDTPPRESETARPTID